MARLLLTLAVVMVAQCLKNSRVFEVTRTYTNDKSTLGGDGVL